MDGWAVSWSDVPGHVSYVLIALSYWMTTVFRLRIIAVIGLVFEILYFRMSSGDMHTGIGWDAVFIVINLYQIFHLVYDERRLLYMKESPPEPGCLCQSVAGAAGAAGQGR